VGDPESNAFARRLEAAKHASTGQLLLRAARLFNETAIERVRATRRNGFRLAHTQLFPHIDLKGTRLTEIAARAGITKQAVGQIVAELEEEGMLERRPDPSDGRAKLVRFTPKGRRALLDGIGVLKSLEDELSAEIGERNMRALRRGLLSLLTALEEPRQI
jgi:DNA-binding MarR family transcriptional regulator